MIPNFSRLKDGLFIEKHTHLPMHGFGRDMPWTILEQDQSSITIQLTDNELTYAQYPYKFAFTAQVVVNEGTLLYTLRHGEPQRRSDAHRTGLPSLLLSRATGEI